MASPAPRIKIIGIGNDWRGDDAAGLLVARLLKESAPEPATVSESRGDPGELLHAWQDADVVIIIDTISSGSPPGLIRRFEAKGRALALHFPPAWSTHSWGLTEALGLGSVFQELPEHLIIFGVEGRNFDFGQGLTPEVKAAVPEAARQIAQEVEIQRRNWRRR